MAVGFRKSFFGFNRDDVIEYIKNLHETFEEKERNLKEQVAELEAASKNLECEIAELNSKIAEYEEKFSEDTGKHRKEDVDIVLL